jgi:hypothetical protein
MGSRVAVPARVRWVSWRICGGRSAASRLFHANSAVQHWNRISRWRSASSSALRVRSASGVGGNVTFLLEAKPQTSFGSRPRATRPSGPEVQRSRKHIRGVWRSSPLAQRPRSIQALPAKWFSHSTSNYDQRLCMAGTDLPNPIRIDLGILETDEIVPAPVATDFANSTSNVDLYLDHPGLSTIDRYVAREVWRFEPVGVTEPVHPLPTPSLFHPDTAAAFVTPSVKVPTPEDVRHAVREMGSENSIQRFVQGHEFRVCRMQMKVQPHDPELWEMFNARFSFAMRAHVCSFAPTREGTKVTVERDRTRVLVLSVTAGVGGAPGPNVQGGPSHTRSDSSKVTYTTMVSNVVGSLDRDSMGNETLSWELKADDVTGVPGRTLGDTVTEYGVAIIAFPKGEEPPTVTVVTGGTTHRLSWNPLVHSGTITPATAGSFVLDPETWPWTSI